MIGGGRKAQTQTLISHSCVFSLGVYERIKWKGNSSLKFPNKKME